MTTRDPVRAETDALSDAVFRGGEWKDQDFGGAEMVEVVFAVGRGPRRRVFLGPLDTCRLVDHLGKHAKELRLIEAHAIRSRENSLADILAQIKADLGPQ